MDTINTDCKQITQQLDAFHDGELMGDEKSAVNKHLASCAECARKLAEIDKVAGALGMMPRVPMPDRLSAKLDGLIDSMSAPTTQPGNVVPFSSKVWRPIAAAAAIAALVYGANWYMNQNATTVAYKIPPASQQPAPEVAKGSVPAVAPNATTTTTGGGTEDIAQTPRANGEHAQQPKAQPNQEMANGAPEIANDAPHAVATKHERAAAEQPRVVASQPAQATVRNDVSEDTVAELPSERSTFNDAVGIATDEDGLYEIKM